MKISRAGRRVRRRLKGGSSSKYIAVFVDRFVTSRDENLDEYRQHHAVYYSHASGSLLKRMEPTAKTVGRTSDHSKQMTLNRKQKPRAQTCGAPSKR